MNKTNKGAKRRYYPAVCRSFFRRNSVHPSATPANSPKTDNPGFHKMAAPESWLSPGTKICILLLRVMLRKPTYGTLWAFVRVTRDPNRKCSGGNGQNQRARFVRSTFDWAVCSEPLARLRRTRAYGYSIVSRRFRAGGKCESALKSAVEARRTDIIFAAYGSLMSNK